MRISKGHLTDIADREVFVSKFCDYVMAVLRTCRLHPVMSGTRIREAHGAWQNDLARVSGNEKNLQDGLDHFKQCGHLAFWLRRMSPLVETHDVTKNLADAEGYPLTDNEIAFRELLLGYSNEYLSFDYAYQICKYYELGKAGGSNRAKSLVPTRDYYQTAVHFMKYKNVSPHAMHLILKSLFFTTKNDD